MTPYANAIGLVQPWLRRPLGVAVLFFVWLVVTAGVRALTLPDEARYAAIAWTMVRSGEWLTPTLNGLPFFHKPPLYYWSAAIFQWLLGEQLFASRIPSLVAATVGAMAVWEFVRRRHDAQVAAWSLVVLGTTFLFYAGAQIATPDMLVDACIAIVICLLGESTMRAIEHRSHGRLVIAAWAIAALGVLAKGLIAVAIPALVIVIWLAWLGQLSLVRTLISPVGVLVFVTVASPWFVAMELLHPGFAQYFFVHHHFERFAGTGFNSVRSWWFYLMAVPLFTLPWFPWLAASAWKDVLLRKVRQQGPLAALMWIWLGTVVVFFSIPQSKPVGYIEPALFAVGYPVARLVCESKRRLLAMVTAVLAAAVCLVYVVGSGLVYDADNRLLGKTLGALRKPGDAVEFVDDFYYDVPMYANLDRPVRVVSDWHDPALASHDDWRRELLEAATFASPKGAADLFVDRTGSVGALCSTVLWVVAPSHSTWMGKGPVLATKVFESNSAILWRVPPKECSIPH